MSPPTKTEVWIEGRTLRPRAMARLFCFNHAGGAAQGFISWNRLLPPELEVCPVQLPGRWTRLEAAPLRRVPEVVEALLSHESLLDLPYLLFGHSLGALIAFEWARSRAARGLPEPRALLIAAAPAPQFRQPDRLHLLPNAEFLEGVRVRYGGVPPEALAQPELLAMVLPPLRTDIEMAETYDFVPGAKLTCPIVAMGGTSDATFEPSQLDGWRDQTSGTFEQHPLEGDHFFLRTCLPAVIDLVGSTFQRWGS